MSAAPRSNTRIAVRLAAMVAVMLSLSYAAVPFYDWFCRVTGYGGATGVAEAESDMILDRVVTVRFDANTAPDMPWEFRPLARTADIRIGETGLAFYEAYNPTVEPIAGTASFNVAPFSAGGYFTKIACFCFEMQVLQPGERIEMPVTFYVDPRIVDDAEAGKVSTITLSYTMHRAELPEEEVSSLDGAETRADTRLAKAAVTAAR
jgi:cytochrome c oxidase assembly protein subunit 11